MYPNFQGIHSMNKILKVFSTIVISLFVLSIFGWMVFHISEEDKNFGVLEKPVTFMYTFPDLFSQSIEEVKTLPPTFLPTPEDFTPVNRLDTDVIVLSTYTESRNKRTIELLNLRNDSVLYSWTVKNPFTEEMRVLNPLMLDHKSLVYSIDGFTGLIRIDSLGNQVWEQDSMHAHHSLNPDSEGNLWICSFEKGWSANGNYRVDDIDFFIKDNYITKIDVNTGEVLFNKSVIAILKENRLENYLLKTAAMKDPLHINDVEPALKTTKYYIEGDVFISVKNLSMIFQYRPSTNQVIRIIEGPFVGQHDVDFLDENTLVLFNNNRHEVHLRQSLLPPEDSSRLTYAGDFFSQVLSYDLKTGAFDFIGDSVFRANEIFTGTEGLQQFIGPDTYLVEEQNSGVIWIIKEDEVVLKNVLTSEHKGYHHLPNWIRVIN